MTYWIKTRNRAELTGLLTFLEARSKLDIPGGLPIATFVKAYGHCRVLRFNSDANGVYLFKEAHVVLLRHLLTSVAQFKRQLALAAKPFVKSRPSFYMGFEIEGCVSDECRDDLKAFVLSLYPGHKLSSLIHSDGSIRPKCRGIEIVTPPMTATKAIEKLEWLLGTLSIMSDEGMFETNGSCGLHVNLSEVKSFDWPNADARHQFTYEFMKRLDPAKWLKAFRRTRNKYCWWAGAPKNAKDVHLPDETAAMAQVIANREGYGLSTAVEKAKHWAAINTTHLNAELSDARRIEVRVAGGKDYHSDTERLRDFLLDIQTAASEAYGSI